MGRRSINTTKSGKYMNPTDQARKEARKKELKKNKKQRQMVRQAVLKGKDPSQLIEEMEKIDEMEYNVYQPSPLNEKVLREKRKKLQDTLHRVLRLYETDDPELWADLKRKEVDYDKRRNKRVQYFESVRLAETVQIDEIPLPTSTKTPTALSLPRIHIPIPPPIVLPTFFPPPGILKKPEETSQNEKASEKVSKDPPGCPSGPPPDLLKIRELDIDYEWPVEEIEEIVQKKNKSIRFSDEPIKSKMDKAEKKSNIEETETVKTPNTVQQKMLELSGQNIDEFMKEMETVQKKKEQDKIVSEDDDDEDDNDNDDSDVGDDNHSKDGEEDIDDDLDDDQKDGNNSIDNSDDDDNQSDEDSGMESKKSVEKPKIQDVPPISMIPLPMPPLPMPIPNPAPLPSAPLSIPNVLPPTNMMFRPPPLRSTFFPPPGPNRPNMPGPPNMQQRMGIRMPPGPPPGLPPSIRQQQHNPHNKHHPHHNNNNSHHHHHHPHQHHQQQQQPMGNISAAPRISKDPKSATITAKPQIRNLSADVTRFVPSALRVKRDEVSKKVKPRAFIPDVKQKETTKGPTKDDAYMQFMKEMQGLL